MIIPYANRMSRVQPSAIRELLRLGNDPEIISFGGGYPDRTLFPIEELHQIFDALLVTDHAAALQYTAIQRPAAAPQAQIAERLSRDGMPATADDVLIIQGGQQGLDLTAKLVIDSGDVIITENPTFLGALIASTRRSRATPPSRWMTTGWTWMISSGLHDDPDATMIYTVPDFQNPTGITLSLPRRKRLIELANAYGVLVVEDSPYRRTALRRRTPAHVEESRHRRPGRAPRQLLQDPRSWHAPRLGGGESGDPGQLTLLKLAADTQSSTLNMAATSAYLSDYDIDAHIAPRPAGLPAQAGPDAADHRGDVPRRHRVHRARRRSLHLADLP